MKAEERMKETRKKVVMMKVVIETKDMKTLCTFQRGKRLASAAPRKP
jgi:hypothetical protein